MVKPDLVICEHSPSALLAAHTMELPKVLVGTGFGKKTPANISVDWADCVGEVESALNSNCGLRDYLRSAEGSKRMLKIQFLCRDVDPTG